jgi:hypothetical protein
MSFSDQMVWRLVAVLFPVEITENHTVISLNRALKAACRFSQRTRSLGGSSIDTKTAPIVIWHVLSDKSISESVSETGDLSLKDPGGPVAIRYLRNLTK